MGRYTVDISKMIGGRRDVSPSTSDFVMKTTGPGRRGTATSPDGTPAWFQAVVLDPVVQPGLLYRPAQVTPGTTLKIMIGDRVLASPIRHSATAERLFEAPTAYSILRQIRMNT